MKVVITGGAGFLGRRLAVRLLEQRSLADPQGRATPIDALVLFDAVSPTPPLADDPRLDVVNGNITDQALLQRVIDDQTGSVFHFAAVVSAAAEADFDLGMRVNLHGTLAVLEACRRLPQALRLVFTSTRALRLGFQADASMDDIVRAFIEDDLPQTTATV